MKNRLYFGFLAIVIFSIGCQTLSRWMAPPLALPPPAQTATVRASQIGTSTLPLPTAKQLSIFEELWQIVREEYLYPDYNGADWDAIGVEYRQRVQAGLTPEAFYQAMDEMLAELNDDHSVFLSPAEAAEEDAVFAGETNYVGIGVLIREVPERQRATIILVFPNSPAAEAGLQSHDNILSVNGQAVLDEAGLLRTDLVLGPAGTALELVVQSPGQSPRTLTIVRRAIQGPLPVPYTLLNTPNGKRIGYLLLTSLADLTIDDQVEEALREMSQPSPLDGLILDNRQNSGGHETVARGVLSLFTKGRLGYFTNRHQERRWFEVRGKNVAGSANLPLVVLIGKDTVSFGEILSGILQDQKRAYLIGTPTEGNIEFLRSYGFGDGSRAWIAHATFYPINNSQQDWEKNGIQPDLVISSNWDEVTLATDPVIQAALEYFDQP